MRPAARASVLASLLADDARQSETFGADLQPRQLGALYGDLEPHLVSEQEEAHAAAGVDELVVLSHGEGGELAQRLEDRRQLTALRRSHEQDVATAGVLDVAEPAHRH